MSAAIKNAAPANMLSGSTMRFDEPINNRTACGTMMPTNPIRPLTATAAEVPSVAASTTMMRTWLTFTPRARASSSPTRNTSITRRYSNRVTALTAIYGNTSRTSPHVADVRRPRIHEYTCRTTSLLRCNTNVCTAVASDVTATPANTSVVAERERPNAVPTVYVSATATTPPMNAAIGTGLIGHVAVASRFTANAIVAPSPAPAATPNKYGSTNGLRNTP